MKKFCLVKGGDTDDLPGTAHAIIQVRGGKKSNDPVRGALLVTVNKLNEHAGSFGNHSKRSFQEDKDEDVDDLLKPLAGRKRGNKELSGGRENVDPDTLENALHKKSRAESSAHISEREHARPLLPAVHKNRKRVALLTNKADVIQLDPASGRRFQLIPNPDEKWRKGLYTAGPPGSGKSTFVAAYLRAYLNMFDGKPRIYGLCATKFADDPAYAGLKIGQLPLEFFDPTGNPPFEVDHLVEKDGSMVIFDDWDSYKGQQAQVVEHAISSIINLGRKKNISIIVTSHLLSNYSHTRGIINGLEWLVVYPHHTQELELVNFLKKMGIKQDVAEQMRGISDDWAAIHQSNPTFILTQHSARMV